MSNLVVLLNSVIVNSRRLEREKPLGDKGCRKEDKSSNSISIDNKDMVAHPFQRGRLE